MSEGNSRTHETRLRVRYSETDAQRIVNNGVYLAYFEVGRVEWLRDAGFSYAKLEREGYGFVVVRAEIDYRKPAHFDDELTIRTTLSELKRASLSFTYEICRDDELLISGRTRHGCINIESGRPVRIPAGLAGDRMAGDQTPNTKTR